MKQCSRCREVKELTEFHKNSTCKDGHLSYCKECKNAARRKIPHMKEKYCPKCDTVKPTSEFFWRESRNDFEYCCKKCAHDRSYLYKKEKIHKETQSLLRLAGWV